MCQQHQASFVKVTIATPSLKLKEGQKSLRHGVTRQLHSQSVAPEKIKAEISNTEDFVNGVSSGTLGQILIRCNNVLWIGKAEEVKAKASKDADMSGLASQACQSPSRLHGYNQPRV
jgi:hypothetical protein